MIELFIFLFGAITGSFLNVCIYRIPNGLSIVLPSSFCPVCKTKIKWYDNIPILSYIFLKGKCRNCKAAISIRYPIVEVLSALVGLMLYKKFGISVEFVFWLVFSFCLIVLSFIDLDYYIIPDSINLLLAVLGIVFELFEENIIQSLIGAVFGFVLFYLVRLVFSKLLKQEALGFGDVKFLGVVGLWEGYKGVLFSIFSASFVGSIIGISLMIIFGKAFKTKIPFGPFLAFGALLYIFIGKQLLYFLYGI